MFKFNHLLEQAGIDVKEVGLIRHRDNRATRGLSPYDLWASKFDLFNLYQSVQSTPIFKKFGWIASFVVTPLGETLFVGLFRNQGVEIASEGVIDPSTGEDMGGRYFYQLELGSPLETYAGRLVIEWGKGYRKWCQNASTQNKEVLELRRSAHDAPFPGFASFRWPINSLDTVPMSWRLVLSQVSGVYVLACRNSEKLYVGAAYGDLGFWGRWQDYLKTGHGGNEGLKKLKAFDFQVSILEVASSAAGKTEIENLESLWKAKLLTREFGHNLN
ncbi:GIY-YIG nuclease family protein [Pseudomonas luteola]